MKVRWLVLIIGLFCAAFCVVAVGQGSSKKKALETKKKTVEKKASTIKKQLYKTKRKAEDVLKDMQRADNMLDEVKTRISSTQATLSTEKQEQSAIAKRLRDAADTLKQNKKQIAIRLRTIYLQGNPSVLSSFIGADSISDVAERRYIQDRLAEQDEILVTELKDARDTIKREKAAQDAIVARIATIKKRQLSEKRELDQRMAFKRGLFTELKETQNELQDELDALEKESANIEAELARYYGSGSSVPRYTGRFLLPVNGRFSSPFGYRIHPISHVRKLHTGQDIAAPSGTPIRAAGNGKVIYAGYRGGYGNCLIIDHGGGVATLYGHCSKLYVGVGTSVKTGQRIAAVGSTGYSTGPHLHWEIRINGKPVNPMGYRGR